MGVQDSLGLNLFNRIEIITVNEFLTRVNQAAYSSGDYHLSQTLKISLKSKINIDRMSSPNKVRKSCKNISIFDNIDIFLLFLITAISINLVVPRLSYKYFYTFSSLLITLNITDFLNY